MEEETAPRERKIRRGIVMLSSFQVALGAVIIAMSFTAFASTSSARVRSASPYWAGFMALFTGSVGFLTWKQLSIVSIGIYTFLSTACVVVSLVATVLTGDLVGFLKTLVVCTAVKFEHACQCCATNATCVPPYKFPSVRDCSIINSFLKDIMYGLCVANILCCIMSLTVTLVGCTLGAQYSRYSQGCAYRLSRPPPHHDYDHRCNWSPYPTDPIENLPPWAPPIYHAVPPTPREVGYQHRRPPPKLFDSIDFPPPYTSREPSIGGRRESQDTLEMEYTFSHRGIPWDRLGPSIFRFFRQGRVGTVSDDSFDYIGHSDVAVLASSSGTSEGVLHRDSNLLRDVSRNLVENVEDEVLCQSQGALLYDRETLPSSSTESDSERPHDNVFMSTEVLHIISDSSEPRHSNPRLAQTNREIIPRRHSWVAHIRNAYSSNVYSAHDEIRHVHIAPNMNPWARSMSENEAHENAQDRNISLAFTKRRSNSTPCYTGYHVNKECDDGNSMTIAEGLDTVTGALHQNSTVVCPEENDSLLRHFTESSKSTRIKTHKKRRRPRNNPGHILEHGVCKDLNTPESSGQETRHVDYRETTL